MAVVLAVLLLHSCLWVHKFTIRTSHDAFKWILNLADATGKLARWGLHLSDFKFHVVHKAGIKSSLLGAVLQIETGGTDTTELADDLPKIQISLTDNRRKIEKDHDVISNLLRIYQQCDDTVETVNRDLPNLAALSHATKAYMATVKTPTLGELLQG